MIVIDVGAARYGGDYSIERLVEMYHPDVLYGFDPDSGPIQEWLPDTANGTKYVLERKAAWIYDGEVRFLEDGLNGQIGDAEHWPYVPCFDLARFIEQLPNDAIVLKLDAEMSEYDLLEHLMARKTDARLTLAVVEWHPLPDGSHIARRKKIECSIACPLEEWSF